MHFKCVGGSEKLIIKKVWPYYSCSVHLHVCRGYVSFAETPNILNETEFREFWVSWKDGRIAVGRGRQPLLQEILAWTDSNPMTISYLTMGMYDNDGYWQIHTVQGKGFTAISH